MIRRSVKSKRNFSKLSKPTTNKRKNFAWEEKTDDLWDEHGDEYLEEKDIQIMDMDDDAFNKLFDTAWDGAMAVYYGDFDPRHDCFTLDGYGNVKSYFNYSTAIEDLVSEREFLNWCVDKDYALDEEEQAYLNNFETIKKELQKKYNEVKEDVKKKKPSKNSDIYDDWELINSDFENLDTDVFGEELDSDSDSWDVSNARDSVDELSDELDKISEQLNSL